MLYEEKAPYLLTILFAALGWTISQVSSDLTKSPIIEYGKIKKINKGETRHIITITNISLENAFSELIFYLRPELTSGAMCLDGTKMIVPPPTELKDPKQEEGPQKPKCINGKYAKYYLPKLHPGTTIQLVMTTNDDVDVNIHLWSEDSVRLVESSLLTMAAKNTFYVMIGLICLWALLLILYIFLIHNYRRNEQEYTGVEE